MYKRENKKNTYKKSSQVQNQLKPSRRSLISIKTKRNKPKIIKIVCKYFTIVQKIWGTGSANS